MRQERRDLLNRVRAINAEVATRYGLHPAPTVRLSRTTRGAETAANWIHRGHTVTVEPATAAAATDEQLAGILGHEHAHIAHGDATRRRWLAKIAPVAGSSLALGAIVLVTVEMLVPAGTAFRFFPPALGLGMVVAAPVALTVQRLPWLQRRAVANQWRELRCDFAAVRAVGRDAVLAALRSIAARERDAADSWPTHPPTWARIAHVETYEVTYDPTTTARAAAWRGQR